MPPLTRGVGARGYRNIGWGTWVCHPLPGVWVIEGIDISSELPWYATPYQGCGC